MMDWMGFVLSIGVIAGTVSLCVQSVLAHVEQAYQRGYRAGWNAAWDEVEDPDPDDGEPIPEDMDNVVSLVGRRAA